MTFFILQIFRYTFVFRNTILKISFNTPSGEGKKTIIIDVFAARLLGIVGVVIGRSERHESATECFLINFLVCNFLNLALAIKKLYRIVSTKKIVKIKTG